MFLAANGWQRHQLKEARAETAAVKADFTELLQRYVGLDNALGQCRKSVQNMIAASQAQQKAGELAAERLAKYQIALAQSQARIRATEDTDRALPACEALLRSDFSAVCPGRAAGVRERALQGPGNGSSRTG